MYFPELIFGMLKEPFFLDKTPVIIAESTVFKILTLTYSIVTSFWESITIPLIVPFCATTKFEKRIQITAIKKILFLIIFLLNYYNLLFKRIKISANKKRIFSF